MLQIEKERSLAYPNQLPAGPRKKRPLGRLFSSSNIFCLPLGLISGTHNKKACLKLND